MSTGSPLVPEGFAYVYDAIKADVLSSISGGTDILSCFVPRPPLPVWRGEIQCRGLGMAVDVFDDEGKPVREEKSELVCTRPFPSMPIGFLGDPDGSRNPRCLFRALRTYLVSRRFLRDHGAWRIDHSWPFRCHAQPGGVRIGTAEITARWKSCMKWSRVAGDRPGLGQGRAGGPVRAPAMAWY